MGVGHGQAIADPSPIPIDRGLTSVRLVDRAALDSPVQRRGKRPPRDRRTSKTTAKHPVSRERRETSRDLVRRSSPTTLRAADRTEIYP